MLVRGHLGPGFGSSSLAELEGHASNQMKIPKPAEKLKKLNALVVDEKGKKIKKGEQLGAAVETTVDLKPSARLLKPDEPPDVPKGTDNRLIYEPDNPFWFFDKDTVFKGSKNLFWSNPCNMCKAVVKSVRIMNRMQRAAGGTLGEGLFPRGENFGIAGQQLGALRIDTSHRSICVLITKLKAMPAKQSSVLYSKCNLLLDLLDTAVVSHQGFVDETVGCYLGADQLVPCPVNYVCSNLGNEFTTFCKANPSEKLALWPFQDFNTDGLVIPKKKKRRKM